MSAARRSSGIGTGSMPAAARLDHPGGRCRRGRRRCCAHEIRVQIAATADALIEPALQRLGRAYSLATLLQRRGPFRAFGSTLLLPKPATGDHREAQT